MKKVLTYKITDAKIASSLKKGGVGVLPTDTLYGIVGSALDERAVERVYELRERTLKKPSIILIPDISALDYFGIEPDRKTQEILAKVWPGQVSVILPCTNKNLTYLHRGTKSLAFRVPKKKSLIALLRKTGPIIAPSANLEGLLPARTVREARDFFDNSVDFYVSGGHLESEPSTIVAIKKGKLEIKRQGAVKIKA